MGQECLLLFLSLTAAHPGIEFLRNYLGLGLGSCLPALGIPNALCPMVPLPLPSLVFVFLVLAPYAQAARPWKPSLFRLFFAALLAKTRLLCSFVAFVFH